MASRRTLLEEFSYISLSPGSSSWKVIECGEHGLTYAQLHQIARYVAVDLSARYGPKPTVAIFSENHPYTFAVILATWMLGGIVAPLDYHAPEDILRGMLTTIEPTCVILPTPYAASTNLAKDMGIPLFAFGPETSNIPELIRCCSSNEKLSDFSSLSYPAPSDDALYMYTSSASSTSTLKCVPLNHASIYANCVAQVSWLHSAFPSVTFERPRVLGWSPWSHIMGISHDIGTWCFLLGGCYVFGVIPSTYPREDSKHLPGSNMDLGLLLLETAVKCRANVFAGVPWVVKRFMEIEQVQEDDKVTQTLRDFKVMISGGAKTDIEVIRWADRVRLKLVIGIGMTELAGPLFHVRADPLGKPGWLVSSSLVADATFTLIDEAGAESTDGELHVRSKLITHGYRRFDRSSFSNDAEGYTTFRTGDLYTLDDGHLIWRGRREDYIQLLSGEILDPRIPERQLDADVSITRSCIVGNNFIKGASEFVCAIIEVPDGGTHKLDDVWRALAAVNRLLAPPLRIPWSRVLILNTGERIPMTRKGVIWRKALEQNFGERLKVLWVNSAQPRLNKPLSKSATEAIVVDIVAGVLGVSKRLLEQHYESTFAEFGMDSQMAVRIVNALNKELALDLPLNACHDHVDLSQLLQAISEKLSLCPPAPTRSFAVTEPTDSDDVVIIGQALRLPGGISTIPDFWDALLQRREDLLGSVPADRWDHASYYDPNGIGKPGMINFDKAGFVDVTSFDNAFFGISTAEALFISPSSRLALETTVEALENANVPLSSVKGTDMAVYVAIAPDDGYIQLLWADRQYDAYTRYYGSGMSSSTVSGRISYFLDVHGPSMSIDTACSGGMVALDSAVQHIKKGGESAVVCSVNVHLWPGKFSFLSANQMASPQGRCATFTKDADGYAPSEGTVALVLKSKSAALRDGNNILGLIKSTAVQHNGRSQGLVAPNSLAQANLQRKLISDAGLSAFDIDFVEVHGTGTTLGDLMEIQAVNDVFGGSHSVGRPLVIGASKTVFGHTESSAGLVGVVKTLLSLRDGLVPGLAHLRADNINPHLDRALVPLVISDASVPLREYRGGSSPLRALTLAYGFAGTISGVILEEHQPASETQSREIRPESPGATPHTDHLIPLPFVASAKTAKALSDYLRAYIEFCSRCQESELPNICYTSCIGRDHYRYRFACAVTTLSDLITRLREALTSDFQPINPKPRLLFAFPGQGSQFQGMARVLSMRNAGFDKTLRDAASDASRLLGIDILPLLLEDSRPEGSADINQTHVAQACIYVFQCVMVEWIRSLGVSPRGVLPLSLGEVSAAVAAMAMSYRTGLEFVIARSSFMRPNPQRPGAMAGMIAPLENVSATIKALQLEQNVCIAGFISKNVHVISGDEWAVDKIRDAALSNGVRCSKLDVNQGFHSHCLDPAMVLIRDWLKARASELHSPSVDYYSSVHGNRLEPGVQLGTEYWVKQAREPILFSAAAEKAAEDNPSIVLDIGPQPVLLSMLRDNPSFKSSIKASLVAKHGSDPDIAFTRALASLYSHGITPDFAKYFAGRCHLCAAVSLPMYPWQRQRHFPSVIPSMHPLKSPSQKKCLGVTEAWDINANLRELLRDHSTASSLVLPAAGLALFITKTLQQSGSKFNSIDMRILKPILIDDTTGNQLLLKFSGTDSFEVTYLQGHATPEPVCAGTLRFLAPSSQKQFTVSLPGSVPNVYTMKSEIYSHLNGGRIVFGPLFQNLTEIREWPDYIDGTIEVKSTGHPEGDLIRKVDACLHMFGAISGTRRNLPVNDGNRSDGSFLPSSLSGFRLFSNTLPSIFTCRYQLPIKSERNSRKMAISFLILSESGELLASCESYAVAWIPSNIPFASTVKDDSAKLMRTVWFHEPALPAASHLPDGIAYVGPESDLRVAVQRKATTLGLSFAAWDTQPDTSTYLQEIYPQEVKRTTVVIYDATLPKDELSLSAVTIYANAALEFMKTITTATILKKVLAVVVLTTSALPILSEDTEGASLMESIQPTASSTRLAGAMIHGMLRVVRRECDTPKIWGLDFPSGPLTGIADILFEEIFLSNQRMSSSVAYRYDSENSVTRLAPCLREETDASLAEDLSPSYGCTIIVGMGDIGTAMAGKLFESGASSIVFIGRKAEDNAEVKSTLLRIGGQYPHGVFTYISADVTQYAMLKNALTKTAADKRLGAIYTVVHTAGVVKDSRIAGTTSETFQKVIAPKVLGAWNLHLACNELKLDIKRFILLSSISVPLGNPGQISYVAANSFLDALATYRNLLDSSRRSISLQLGAWESQLTSGMNLDDGPVSRISHKEGIPLLLKAINGKRSIQILAALRPKEMRKLPSYSQDPYFAEFLNLDPTNHVPPAEPLSLADVEHAVNSALREVLEMTSDEPLDLYNSLASFGLDSIAFTQLRGGLLKKFNVNVPMSYLGEEYTARDIVDYISTAGSA